MKKIFHFVKSNNLSGLENVVINICTLVKGYDYTYVSTEGPIEGYLKKYGIKHITIPKLTPWNIFKVIKKYNPDIVQAHDARASVFLAFSYFYCKRHHIKMISELHNNDPKMHNKIIPRSILYMLASFAFNTIIVVSKDIINDYSYKTVIKNNKVKYIQNIVNPKRIKNGLLMNTKKKWDCIFVGRFSYQKNPMRFVKIIKILKQKKRDIRAIMVGSGKLLKPTKHLVNKLHLNKNIRFIGFTLDPYKYMQQSKVLLITSRFEGLCLVALEALIVGIPVFSTRIKGLEHILKNSCGGLMDNNYDLARCIYKCISNHNIYIFYSRNALSVSSKVNCVNTFINSYNDIYK